MGMPASFAAAKMENGMSRSKYDKVGALLTIANNSLECKFIFCIGMPMLLRWPGTRGRGEFFSKAKNVVTAHHDLGPVACYHRLSFNANSFLLYFQAFIN